MSSLSTSVATGRFDIDGNSALGTGSWVPGRANDFGSRSKGLVAWFPVRFLFQDHPKKGTVCFSRPFQEGDCFFSRPCQEGDCQVFDFLGFPFKATWLWVKINGTILGVGAPPILVYFSWDWDVHWGYRRLTHGLMRSTEFFGTVRRKVQEDLEGAEPGALPGKPRAPSFS